MICRLRVRRGLCADKITPKPLKNSLYQSEGYTKAATLMSSYNHQIFDLILSQTVVLEINVSIVATKTS